MSSIHEQLAIVFAKKLNEIMIHLPNHRLECYGTRVDVRPAAGHYFDAGLDATAEFARAFRVHVATEPSFPDPPGVAGDAIAEYALKAADLGRELKKIGANIGAPVGLARLQLIQEELAELAEALWERNLVKVLDALTDLTYVVDGSYLTFGMAHLKLAALAEVHRSNMTKLDEDGNPVIGPSGRVVKGPNYEPPKLAEILGEAGE